MAEPTCEKCGEHKFESRYLEDAKTVLVFCDGCGHIVGVMPDYQDIAQTVILTLTRGAKDNHGHPVVRIKQEDTVYG